MACSAGGHAAGTSSLLRIRSWVSNRGLSPNKFSCHSQHATCPSSMESRMVLVIYSRMRSSSLSVVVVLFMYMWSVVCVYRVYVCSCMSRFYSSTQIRGVQKTHLVSLNLKKTQFSCIQLHVWLVIVCKFIVVFKGIAMLLIFFY